MVYKYEKENKAAVMINQPKANKELKEVYRKACAFDRIAEVHSDNDHYSDEYVMETIQEQIDLMERTDDER